MDVSAQGREMAKADESEAPSEEPGTVGLSESEQNDVKELEEKYRGVRTHEQAHLMAAGNLARSGANFEYKIGPDGKRYAVGGEVNIDTGEVEGDSQATISKADRIQSAAMAPADPSPKDMQVAAEANAMAAEARQELAKE